MDVRTEWGNIVWPLPGRINRALYFIIQESLTNAFRHGHAGRVEILLWRTDTDYVVSIQDDGRGGPVSEKGIGRSSMESRIRGVDGTVHFENNSIGYLVRVRIPIREDRNGTDQHPAGG